MQSIRHKLTLHIDEQQQWESGDEDSETEEDKYDNKKEQRDSRGRKKKKLVVTEYVDILPVEGILADNGHAQFQSLPAFRVPSQLFASRRHSRF